MDLTTAPQDECLTHCAQRLCPGYSALTEVVFSAVRTVQQHNCAADIIFKEEALSITLSCSVKRYAVFIQLSTGGAFFDLLFITARGLCAIYSDPFHIARFFFVCFFLKSKLRTAAKVSGAQHIFMQVSESKFKSLNTELNLASYTKMFDSQLSHH